MTAPRWRASGSILDTGCRWRDLPPQLGFGSGHTACRRLREWQAAGVWERLHRLMLDELSDAEVLDWSRGCIDSLSVRAESACAAQLPQAVPRSSPLRRMGERVRPQRPSTGRSQPAGACSPPSGDADGVP